MNTAVELVEGIIEGLGGTLKPENLSLPNLSKEQALIGIVAILGCLYVYTLNTGREFSVNLHTGEFSVKECPN